MKLNALKFALAGGFCWGISIALITLLALLKAPGFVEFANILLLLYGDYGYLLSWLGIFSGAILGFIVGFLETGFFAWFYNRLVK